MNSNQQNLDLSIYNKKKTDILSDKKLITKCNKNTK